MYCVVEHTFCIIIVLYQGMKPSTAEYWLLKEVSHLDSFGEELFHSKPSSEGGVGAWLGVGPHGISLYHGEDLSEKLRYTFDVCKLARSVMRANIIVTAHVSIIITSIFCDFNETVINSSEY